MFKTAAPVAEPAHDIARTPGQPETDLIPLSHLELDLPAPTLGWLIELDRRHIEIVVDDIGRRAISRADARLLITEQREAEARKREAARRQELEAVEADRLRRASIWRGIPAEALPVSVSAASAMLAADHAAKPKRLTPLEEALSNSGEMTYHRLPSTDEE